MPWTKSLGTATAETANEDLQMGFYYSDAEATPPNAIHVWLKVKNDVNPDEEEADALLTATSLTAGERSTLLGLLAKLRDDGLAVLGYTET